MPPLALVRRICTELNVEEDDVRSNCRLHTPVRVRKLAVYVLRMDRGLTYGEIARVLQIKRSVAQGLYNSARRAPDPLVTRFLGVE